MTSRRLLPLFALCLAVPVACGGSDDQAAADAADLAEVPQHAHKSVCADAIDGFARCHAHVRVDASGNPQASAAPSGFGPADLISAYQIPTSGGAGVTVAIVDAFDDPNAEADLAVYRKQFGLPACTTANGCFKKVSQTGSTTTYPKADSGWAEEISLDLDMVSAACPSCKILLVEATSASNANLGAAVNEAIKLGATVVSNSYGGSESSSDASYDSKYYKHTGALIVASSGDGGYGVEYPAASPDVLAVGGTKLVKSTNARGWTEAAWTDAGSGCSKYGAKPSWQKDTGCANRTVADVSAVADPDTGVAVYDSYGGVGGWLVFGGTSVASPLVASIFARAGIIAQGPGFPYAHTGAFNDVTSGSNGTCAASVKYLCTAVKGYDGPTGLGTPNGKSLVSAKAIAGN